MGYKYYGLTKATKKKEESLTRKLFFLSLRLEIVQVLKENWIENTNDLFKKNEKCVLTRRNHLYK
jgi:hypothetical protein